MPLSSSTMVRAVLSQMFVGLNDVLDKGVQYAKSKNVEESVLLNWRLTPDMFSMDRQVQIATEVPARGMARLAGVELPSFPDTEKTFEELRARIAKSQAFIKDLDSAKIDADPEGDITFPIGPETMTLKRQQFALNFILPNLYFHVTMAYANLRACGVPVGKADFLAWPPR